MRFSFKLPRNHKKNPGRTGIKAQGHVENQVRPWTWSALPRADHRCSYGEKPNNFTWVYFLRILIYIFFRLSQAKVLILLSTLQEKWTLAMLFYQNGGAIPIFCGIAKPFLRNNEAAENTIPNSRFAKILISLRQQKQLRHWLTILRIKTEEITYQMTFLPSLIARIRNVNVRLLSLEKTEKLSARPRYAFVK